MPVVELAKSRMLSGEQQIPFTLSQKLLHAGKVMEEASGYQFTFMQCDEDHNVILIIGAWPSAEFHTQRFLPSTSNKELLQLLKDDITVDWMFHIDMRPDQLLLAHTGAVTTINRYFIEADKRLTFESDWMACQHNVHKDVPDRPHAIGGWRLDMDPMDEEFVSFTTMANDAVIPEVTGEQRIGNDGQFSRHVVGREILNARPLAFCRTE